MITTPTYTTIPSEVSTFVLMVDDRYKKPLEQNISTAVIMPFLEDVNYSHDKESCYDVLPIESTALDGELDVFEIYGKLLQQFNQVCTIHNAEVRPIFIEMASIAVSSPLKAFHIDYSAKSKTLDFRLLLNNGIKILLSKSAETKDDDYVSYSFIYNRQTLDVNICSFTQLRRSIPKIMEEVQAYV